MEQPSVQEDVKSVGSVSVPSSSKKQRSEEAPNASHSTVAASSTGFAVNSLFLAINVGSTSSEQANPDSKYKKIVGLPAKGIFYVAGFCRIRLLKGKLAINGAELKPGQQVTVKNPVWTPACRVFSSSSSSSSSASKPVDVDAQLVKLGLSVTSDVLREVQQLGNEVSCLFYIEGMSTTEQEWLVAAEDMSLLRLDSVLKRHNIGRTADDQLSSADAFGAQQCSICSVHSAMIGSLDHMTSLGLEVMSIPESWNDSVKCVGKAVSAALTTSSSGGGGGSDAPSSSTGGSGASDGLVKTVICGPRNVGKSSCLRYTVNSLLSSSTAGVDAVCVIDCDIGQPESTVPGMMSLQVFTGPILEAVHYNVHRTHCPAFADPAEVARSIWERRGTNQLICSYFLGDVTTKNNPQLMIECVNRLVEQYTLIAQHFQAMEVEGKAAKRSSSSGNLAGLGSSNMFAALNSSSDNNRSAGGKPRRILPLVVNTDGNIRGMGAEVILPNILSAVRPSHIFQFSDAKNQHLTAVMKHRSLSSTALSEAHYSAQDLDGEAEDNGGGGGGGGDDWMDRQDKGVGCVLRVLESGRISTAKVDASLLRVMRQVSYFLAGPADDSTVGRQLKRAALSGDLLVKRAVLVDRHCLLAVSLLRLSTLVLPLDGAVLQSIAGVAPALMLAALNASLVGLVHLPPPSASNDEAGVVERHRLVVRSESGEQAPRDCGTVLVMPGDLGARVQPCVGLAVVKCIDLEKRHFAIAAPLSTARRVVDITAAAVGSGQKVSAINLARYGEAAASGLEQRPSLAMVKGEVTLQLPNVLIYAHGLPSYPYLSSESAGLSSSMKTNKHTAQRRALVKKG